MLKTANMSSQGPNLSSRKTCELLIRSSPRCDAFATASHDFATRRKTACYDAFSYDSATFSDETATKASYASRKMKAFGRILFRRVCDVTSAFRRFCREKGCRICVQGREADASRAGVILNLLTSDKSR